MHRMADLAESLAAHGYDGLYIAQELQKAADEAEFGWTGAKYLGADTGVFPESEVDEIRSVIAELIDRNPRAKTIRKDELSNAIWEES
jgi:hypothetical protein